MTRIIEKVSTVGIRKQITLPRAIREKLFTGGKTIAYIQARDKEGFLAITLQPPATGTYNKISISSKGQMVIPKNLRESKGIKAGDNLVFSIRNGEIRLKKLAEQRSEREPNFLWNFLVEIINWLESAGSSNVNNVSVAGNSLLLVIKSDNPEPRVNVLLETVRKLETLLATRLIIEKLQDNKVKLTRY